MNIVARVRKAPFLLLTTFAALGLSCAASLPARAQYTFLRSFGSSGSGNGQFTNPSDIKIDSNGNVFVLDNGNHRVQEFTALGVSYLNQFGSSGTGDGQFTNSLGLAIDSGNNIFVSDSNSDFGRVEKFSNSGVFQTEFGRTDDNPLQLPVGVAFDSSGSVYVSEAAFGFDSVRKFTVSGNTFTQVAPIGSPGTGNGELNVPYGVAIDRNNNIFVVDSFNNRVEEFDSSGGFVRTFSAPVGSNRLFQPHDIAIDANGNIFVTDHSNDFVARFNSVGQYQDQFGTKGMGAGQIGQAEGVTVDALGNIYVADTLNNRVDVFSRIAVVPETGTLLTLACMTVGGLCVTRRLKKERRSQPVTPSSSN